MVDTITPQLIAAAQEAYDSFEQRTRDNGNTFYTLKDDARAEIGQERGWIQEMCFTAHGDMLPDDWRYEFIHSALAAIADASEDADSYEVRDEMTEPDIYTSELTGWLASRNDRCSYCDEAVSEFGQLEDTIRLIGAGQMMEKGEVFDSVLRSLSEHIEATEERTAA